MDNKPKKLSDGDIASKRAVSRRVLLGRLGLAAGAVAAGTVVGVSPAPARDRDTRSSPRPCDRDPGGQVDRVCWDP